MPFLGRLASAIAFAASAHMAVLPALAVESPYFRMNVGTDGARTGLYIDGGPSGAYRVRVGSTPDAGSPKASYNPVTWSYQGTLPPGMGVNPSTGALTGAPSAIGSYSAVLQATYLPPGGAKAQTATGPNFTITSIGAPTLAYSVPPQVAGGTRYDIYPVVSNVISGTYSPVSPLPAGLALDATTGIVSVLPTATGSYPNITIKVVDSDKQAATSNPFTVTVGARTASVNAENNKVAVLGVPFTLPLSVSGLAAPVSYSLASGTMPPGLSFCSAPDSICSTPTAVGTYSGLVVSATGSDGLGTVMQTPITIRVAAPSLAYNNQTVTVGKSVNVTPTSAYLQGATYSFQSTPPAGITIDPATGTVSGPMNNSGDFTMVVVASVPNAVAPYDKAVSQPFHLIGKVDAFVVSSASEFIQAHVGYPIKQPFTSNPAVSGLLWSVSQGALPDGLSLNQQTGVVSGAGTTPTNVSNVVITASAGGQSATTDPLHYDIKALPTVTAASSYSTMQGQAVTLAVTAQNLIGAGTYTADQSKLPPGVTLGSNGTFTGTPTTAGSYDGIVVTVSDAFDGASGKSQPFTITVSPSDGSMTVATADTYRIRQNKTLTTQAPTVSGTTSAVTWSLAPDSAPLPDGLRLDPNTGIISGTPTTPGDTANIILVATEVVTKSGFLDFFTKRIRLASNDPSFVVAQATPKTPRSVRTRKFTITVGPQLTVGNVQPTYKMKVATPIDVAPRAAGVMGSTTWRLTGGTLPNAAAFDPSTGRIAGPALVSGRIPGGNTGGDLVIQAVDSFDGEVASSQPFSLTIDPGIIILGPSTLTAKINQAYSSGNAFTAANPVGNLSWSVIGTLPAGFAVDSATGIIAGQSATPSLTLDLRMQATQPDGTTGVSPPFTFAVQGGLQVAYPSYVVAHINQPMPAINPTVSGASGSVTWAIASGSLPPGVTMNPATGALIGTPTVGGLFYDIRIQATDSSGANGVSPPTVLNINNGLSWAVGVLDQRGRKNSQFTTPPLKVTNVSGDVHFRFVNPLYDWKIDANTGVITGTMQNVRINPDWLVAYDSTGASISHGAVSFNAYDPLSWYCSYETVCSTQATTNVSAVAGVGIVFSLLGKPSYEKVGTWPDWLSLDPTSGNAIGVPPAAGTYVFETKMTDGFDGQTSNRKRSLVVTDGTSSGRSFYPAVGGGTTICAVTGQNFDIGAGYLRNFGPGTTVTPYNSYGGSSQLPAWMNLDKTNGRIYGTVPADASADFWMPVVEYASDPAIANDRFDWDGGNRYLSSYATAALFPPNQLAQGYYATYDYGWFDNNQKFTFLGGRDNRRIFVSGGTLPPGMTVDSDALYGTPTTPGSYTVTVTMSATQCNGTVVTASRDIVINVMPPPQAYVVNPLTVYARKGIPFRSGTASVGGVPANAPTGMKWGFNLRNGGLPSGVNWEGTNGTMFGTPAGTWNDSFRWEANGNACCSWYAIGNWSRLIVTNGPAITMTDVSVPQGIPAQVVTNSSGFSGPVGWSSTGTLPPGLGVDPGTGAIVGTPTAVGTYGPITVTGTEKQLPPVGPNDPVPPYPTATSNTFKVTVVPGPYIDNYGDQRRRLGSPFAVNPRANGFTGTVRWQLVGDTPDGVQFDVSSGAISGAGAKYGEYQVQLVATGNEGTAFSEIFKLTVTDQDDVVPKGGDVTWTWGDQVCIYGCDGSAGCQGRQLQNCTGKDCPVPVRGCSAPFSGGDTSFPVGQTATDCPYPTISPNESFCPKKPDPIDNGGCTGPNCGGGTQTGSWYYYGWYLQTKHTNGFVVYHNRLACYVGTQQVDASQCPTPPTSIGSCVVNGYGVGNCGTGVPFTGSQIQTSYVADTSYFYD